MTPAEKEHDRLRTIQICVGNVGLLLKRLDTWPAEHRQDLIREYRENLDMIQRKVEEGRNDWRLFSEEDRPYGDMVIEIKCHAGSYGFGPARMFDWSEKLIKWWRPKK